MSVFPVMLDLKDTPIWCVGGGNIAARKVTPMAKIGAQVTVISPSIHDDLKSVIINHIPRKYQTGDITDSGRPALVIAATNNPIVNSQVQNDAAALSLWCLRIDEDGDMTLPAMVPVDSLTVAVATGVPALTSRLSTQLAHDISPEWSRAAGLLGSLRSDPTVRNKMEQLDSEEQQTNWRLAVDAALDGEDDCFVLQNRLTEKPD